MMLTLTVYIWIIFIWEYVRTFHCFIIHIVSDKLQPYQAKTYLLQIYIFYRYNTISNWCYPWFYSAAINFMYATCNVRAITRLRIFQSLSFRNVFSLSYPFCLQTYWYIRVFSLVSSCTVQCTYVVGYIFIADLQRNLVPCYN